MNTKLLTITLRNNNIKHQSRRTLRTSRAALTELLKRVSAILLFFAILTPAPFAQVDSSEEASPPEKKTRPIKLKSRTFIPGKSDVVKIQADVANSADTSAAADARVHILVQLDRIPGDEEKATLEEQGIKLLSYVPDYAWVASVPVPALEETSSNPMVNWLGGLELADKVSTDILEGDFGDWHYIAERDEVAVVVHIHKDIQLSAGREAVVQHGGEVRNEVQSIHSLTAHVPRNSLQALAQDDRISYVETAMPALTETNDGQQAADNIDVLQPAPYTVAPTYSLDGSGVDVLVYDSGQVDDHIDFGTRLVHGDADSVSSHSTHVAGTVAGDGTNSAAQGGSALEWHGVAPGATVISYGTGWSGGTLFYTDVGDVESDWDDAKNIHGADIGTASLSSNIYLNGYACSLYGDYGAASELMDEIVRGSLGEPYIATWAAGNERNGGTCAFNYSSTSPPAGAKNPIHVGASNSNDSSMTTFSSWGPTDDGRLKPTITASGCENGDDNGITSTDIGDTYSDKCGTSMATPGVAGIIALMLEQYRDTYASSDEFLPSTAKAILINSAIDAGDVGPDYGFGYGLVDAQAAVDTIIDGRFREATLNANGEEHEYAIRVIGGTSLLQVSLAWDDPAAAAYSANALVNDLDIELISPTDVVHQAWVLDPANPVTAATTGTDTLNNQEQVTVNNPEVGVWRVRVTGSVVPTTPQQYSLAATQQLISMDILHPTASVSQDIGPFDEPGKLLIRLAIKDNHGGPFTTPINPAIDLDITIGSEPVNNIILATVVGNEYWVLVNAPTQLALGCYDLDVTLFAVLSDSETNAVCYTEANEEDVILVMDASGSMANSDKLDAAKDASQFFITMTDVDDKIGAVSFSWVDPSTDNTAVVYPLTTITGDIVKNAASLAIEGITATDYTPLGSGMETGNNEMIASSDPTHDHTIILLSDGRHNRGIDWVAVEPTVAADTVIHTVGFGPEGDPDDVLLADIATNHNGNFWRVYTGDSATDNVSVASDTANVLADVYRRAAEETLDWQRFWEVSGKGGSAINVVPKLEIIPKLEVVPLTKSTLINEVSQLPVVKSALSFNSTQLTQPALPVQPIVPVNPITPINPVLPIDPTFPITPVFPVKPSIIRNHTVSVEAGLGVVIFAAHWNQEPNSEGIMSLRRPDGTEVNSSDADVIGYRVYGSSSGHEQYILTNPQPGEWTVGIHSLSDTDAEYIVMAETRSDADLLLLSPKSLERGFCTPIPVRAAFVDHEPILGASVVAEIVNGDGSQVELTLYDDGLHDDGDANDGLYGNTYNPCSQTVVEKSVAYGSYTTQIKVEAEGIGSFGTSVERSVTSSYVRTPFLVDIIDQIYNPVLVDPKFVNPVLIDQITNRIDLPTIIGPQIIASQPVDPDVIKVINPAQDPLPVDIIKNEKIIDEKVIDPIFVNPVLKQ